MGQEPLDYATMAGIGEETTPTHDDTGARVEVLHHQGSEIDIQTHYADGHRSDEGFNPHDGNSYGSVDDAGDGSYDSWQVDHGTVDHQHQSLTSRQRVLACAGQQRSEPFGCVRLLGQHPTGSAVLQPEPLDKLTSQVL